MRVAAFVAGVSAAALGLIAAAAALFSGLAGPGEVGVAILAALVGLAGAAWSDVNRVTASVVMAFAALLGLSGSVPVFLGPALLFLVAAILCLGGRGRRRRIARLSP